MSYSAIVTKITTRPLEGSDNLLLANCGGYTVLVGKNDFTEGNNIGVFFGEDGQLSEEMATVLDLVRRKDADGKSVGGYLDANRRIRSIKMRGIISEGLVLPLSAFAYTGARLSDLKEGDEFTSLNGHLICQRYETPATKNAIANRNTKMRRGEIPGFAKQPDIQQLKHAFNSVPNDSLIILSEKIHGTSGRFGYVLDSVPIKRTGVLYWIEKLLRLPIK